MTYPKTKQEITQTVLSEIPESVWNELPLDEVIFRWWMTGRAGYGLRLSDEGAGAFNQANIAFYEFPLGFYKHSSNQTPEAFVQSLSKKIQGPYWIGLNKDKKTEGPQIRVYDHRIAVMMTLYGNLQEYLESIQV
jgi:hypothetical protein